MSVHRLLCSPCAILQSSGCALWNPELVQSVSMFTMPIGLTSTAFALATTAHWSAILPSQYRAVRVPVRCEAYRPCESVRAEGLKLTPVSEDDRE